MSDLRIKDITVKNIQVHKDAVIRDLPENGLIVFTGENSAGKSAILGLLINIMSTEIKEKNMRRNYVNYNENVGLVNVVFYNGLKLEVRIDVESPSASYYRFTKDGAEGEQLIYFSDKMLKDKVRAMFNIHSWEKESLNYHKTFGNKLLCVETTPKETYSILKGSFKDIKVEKSLEYMKDELKTLRTELLSLKSQIKGKEELISQSKVSVEDMKKDLDHLKYLRTLAYAVEYPLIVEPERVMKTSLKPNMAYVNAIQGELEIEPIMEIKNYHYTKEYVSAIDNSLIVEPMMAERLNLSRQHILAKSIEEPLIVEGPQLDAIEKLISYAKLECPECGRSYL